MYIAWLAWPTQCEVDIARSCDRAGVAFRIFTGANADLPKQWVDALPWTTRHSSFSDAAIAAIASRPDLLVIRYGFFAAPSEFERCACPVVVWMSEQGATRSLAFNCARALSNSNYLKVKVATNNAIDRDLFGESSVVMPFGCCAAPALTEGGQGIICASDPHYACNCAVDEGSRGAKRESADTLVAPLIPLGVQVYGTATDCGWPAMPGMDYRGWLTPDQAAAIEKTMAVLIGISFNWRSSGYGMKLARSLGHGGPAVVWHRTPGMARDGLVEGENILCAASPTEVKDVVGRLLGDEAYRRGVVERGWVFAREKLEWAYLLRKLAEDVTRREVA